MFLGQPTSHWVCDEDHIFKHQSNPLLWGGVSPYSLTCAIGSAGEAVVVGVRVRQAVDILGQGTARPFNDRENNLNAVLCIDMEGRGINSTAIDDRCIGLHRSHDAHSQCGHRGREDVAWRFMEL